MTDLKEIYTSWSVLPMNTLQFYTNPFDEMSG